MIEKRVASWAFNEQRIFFRIKKVEKAKSAGFLYFLFCTLSSMPSLISRFNCGDLGLEIFKIEHELIRFLKFFEIKEAISWKVLSPCSEGVVPMPVMVEGRYRPFIVTNVYWHSDSPKIGGSMPVDGMQ